jgi:DNA-binding transcriptional LysR family regulator
MPDGPFEAAPILTDPYVLLVPSDSPLARRRTATLADIGDLPLIGSNQCASGAVVEEALREAGYEVEYKFQSDDNGTLQGLVAAGFGVALWPLLAVMPGDDRVKVLRLEPAIPRRSIAVVWHRDRHRTPAALAFVDIAREVSADVQRELDEPRRIRATAA